MLNSFVGYRILEQEPLTEESIQYRVGGKMLTLSRSELLETLPWCDKTSLDSQSVRNRREFDPDITLSVVISGYIARMRFS